MRPLPTVRVAALRPRRALTTLAALTPLLFAAGCSSPPERPILDRYFRACRLRDTTALASISTVRFEPATDGMVSTFDITNIGAERHAPASPEITRLSLAGTQSIAARPDADPPLQDIELLAKDVTISARVSLPDGTMTDRTLVVTLQRAVAGAGGGVTGKWIVTRVHLQSTIGSSTIGSSTIYVLALRPDEALGACRLRAPGFRLRASGEKEPELGFGLSRLGFGHVRVRFGLRDAR